MLCLFCLRSKSQQKMKTSMLSIDYIVLFSLIKMKIVYK